MSDFLYSCPACGASEFNLPSECCDECIVKFYLRNRNAPSIDQYSHWVEYEEDDLDDE